MHKTVNIYIATHKSFNVPLLDGYIPLHVGAKDKEELYYQRDDKGENISYKNNYYCELTGLYWIWKNATAEYVGLTHYRRYFTYNNKESYGNILNVENIKRIFDNCDIIVPNKKYYNVSVRTQYWMTHYLSDLYKVQKICHNLYPEYDESFKTVMRQKSMYAYNMLICDKKIFNEYCEWLFSILFELEKCINLSTYDNYQRRLFGFLSERLFNVWINYHKEIRIYETAVFNTENNDSGNKQNIKDVYKVSYIGIFKHFITQLFRITRW